MVSLDLVSLTPSAESGEAGRTSGDAPSQTIKKI